MSDVIVGLLAIAGASLVLLAGIGVVRFPDLYSRMHAATKAPTLGIALVAVAAAIALDDGRSKVLLATAVIFVTGPSAAHFVARSAYRREGIDLPLEADDELARRRRRG